MVLARFYFVCYTIAMNKDFELRDVLLEDAGRLAEIYAPYVLGTAVSFEYDAPSAGEFQNRINRIKEKYPYIVCVKNGVIAGYVYASEYGTRKAYDWSAATSIYVAQDCRGQGIGTALYAALEDRLRKQGIVNLLAGVAFCEEEDEYLSHASYKFHLRKGYEEVGRLKSVGRKFGRWYDLLWMQKRI